jgi:basic membrane lipoprotein Med (substrate-binding protein (PBP1-ABC) superfamily)
MLPPHGVNYHDKVVQALKDDPNQHFIIEDGVVYLVDGADLIRELNDE